MSPYSDGNAMKRMKKIIKNTLIVFGGLFVVIVVFGIFMTGRSADFLEENQGYFISFSEKLSENWEPNDVYPMLSNEFIGTLGTPNSDAFFRHMKSYGKLVETSDFAMQNYLAGTGGITAIVTFKAVYENVNALVTLTVVKNSDKVLIQGFHINPVGPVPFNEHKEYEA